MVNPASPRLFASLLVLATPLAFGACSGGTGSAPGGAASTPASGSAGSGSPGLSPKAQEWVLGTYEGKYDAATKQFTLVELPAPEGTVGSSFAGNVTPEMFGVKARGATSLVYVNGANSGAQANCGDATRVIPSLPNSFCAAVSVQNNSNRQYNLVWSEFFAIQSGVSVALSGDSKDNLPVALDNLVSETIGAYNYDNIAPGASTPREWVFRNVGASNFTFKVQIKTAPTRTGYAVTAGPVAFVDACSLAGSTVQVAPGDDVDPANNLPAPFPITVYNLANTSYAVTPEGVFSLDPDQDSGGANGAHVTLPTATMSSGTVFPYWAQQIPRQGNSDPSPDPPLANGLSGSVCTAVEGTTVGSRFLDITWKNMRLESAPVDDTNLTYTLRISEANDSLDFQYDMLNDQPAASWPNPLTPANQVLTPRSRGLEATIGFQGITSGANCNTPDTNFCTLALFNQNNIVLTGSAANYPRHRMFTPGQSN